MLSIFNQIRLFCLVIVLQLHCAMQVQKHMKITIYVYTHTPQDGEMIPYTKELGDKLKHSLKKIGKKYIFSMRDLMPEDAGLYQLDVEDVNMFSTDFKSKHFYNCT